MRRQRWGWSFCFIFRQDNMLCSVSNQKILCSFEKLVEFYGYNVFLLLFCQVYSVAAVGLPANRVTLTRKHQGRAQGPNLRVTARRRTWQFFNAHCPSRKMGSNNPYQSDGFELGSLLLVNLQFIIPLEIACSSLGQLFFLWSLYITCFFLPLIIPANKY